MAGGRYRGASFAQQAALAFYDKMLAKLKQDFPMLDAQGILGQYMEENAPGDSGVSGIVDRATGIGQRIADSTQNAANQAWPIQETVLDQLKGFLGGGQTPDQYSPVMQAAKNQSERSYAQGLDQLIANTGAGGARTAGLVDLLTNRANTMIDTRSNVAQDLYNKAYETGANVMPQYVQGMGQAGNVLNQAGTLGNVDQANKNALYSTNINSLGNALALDANQQQAMLNTLTGQAGNAMQTTSNIWGNAGSSESASKGGKASGLGSLGAGLGSFFGASDRRFKREIAYL